MNVRCSAGFLLCFAALTARADIQTAGALLLDVSASSLSALGHNTAVAAWTNSGTLGGQFVPAVSGQGALYQTSVGGAPAVTFAASANSVMTNSVLPPTSILSNNIWSAEIWVLNPTLENPEDQLVWTDRGNWTGSSDGTCMEIRYCVDVANAVEHYNGTCNIPWSGNPPQAGLWHHVVIARSSDGSERLYADGVLRTTKTPAVANLRGGGRFALGGVWDRAASNWQMLFSGSLARARIHSGTLSDAQVLNNYLFERPNFQAAWTGAAGSALPWSDAGNWLDGNIAEAGETAWVTNGGTAVLSSSVQLYTLFATHGGLIVTNGAALTFPAVSTSLNMGDGSGKQFSLTVADGRLALPGNNVNNLYMGANGGRTDATVGGGATDAVIDMDRDLILGNGWGSVGRMTLGANGSVYTSNGWFYVGNGIYGDGRLEINGGTVGFRMADKSLVIGGSGARSEVVVNSGRVDATGDIKWAAGTSTNLSYGVVRLNGGTIQAKRFEADTTAGTNLLFLNGGTVKARDSRADFLFNLTAAYVQSGGAVFDIPTNVAVSAAQGLTEDPSSAGGSLTKNGAGRITLSGANTLTGNIAVNSGDLFFRNASGLPSGYAGSITLAGNGSIGYEKAGGAALLLSKLAPAATGYLTLFGANAAENVDFSTFQDLKLFLFGFSNYTGTFTPCQGQYNFKVEGSVVTNGAALADAGATPGHLSVLGTAGSGMVLTGNNTFTGGAEIDTATLVIAHANALGTQSTPGLRDVDLRNGGVIRFDADMDVTAFVSSRLTTTSSGFLLLGAANAGKNVDLSSHPGVVLGSAELSLDYSGTITPSSGGYRLGGGNAVYSFQGYRGLSVSNLSDVGGPTPVVIGTPGNVELKSGNTYSGGTVLTNRGVLFLKQDGLGAVPASPDPVNLIVNNGVIRSGSANFSLHANRGISVGGGGMELHPWGGYTMTVQGNLSGSGRIFTTDGGYVTFGGADNSYNGRVEINAGHNLRVGSGPSFSWVSAGGVVDNGTLYLKTDNTSTFADTVSGSGALRKEGSGTLTLTAPASYAGVTHIDAGTLRVSATNVLPRGAGRGVVELKAGAALDANGGDLLVGGLSGAGLVTNSAGTLKTVYAGENNVTSTYGGAIDPALTLVKIGNGKQTIGGSSVLLSQAAVQSGVLELSGAVTVSGTATVSSGATLAISDAVSGLVGEFFDLASTPVTSDFVSLASVTALLAGRTPNLTTSSAYLGTTFDLGATSTGFTPRFPTGYNTGAKENFVTRWTGYFLAEQAGSYTFATASDDGSMLFIDGATVVDNNAMQSYLPSNKKSGSAALTAGLHTLVIVMYDAAGDQGLTVWLTVPGGAEQVLPTRLLYSGNTGSSMISSLAGAAGSVLSFTGVSGSTLSLTGNADMSYAGSIQSSNTASRLLKTGSGNLTLSSTASDFYGTLDIQAGNLLLTNGAGTLGTLAMSDGATTIVAGQNGLQMHFYNRSAADNDYSEFQSMAAWETYLNATFPSGPNYVTNSQVLGVNLDTGAGGEYWPDLYKQSSGSEAETYDAYLFGGLYLNRSGTYTFATASDDGSMLFIDRTLVVQNGYNQGVTQRTGTMALTAGFHDIAIPYRENTGGNALRVYIGYPGEALILMPQSILFKGTTLRGLAGSEGSSLNLGSAAVVVLNQDANTTHAGDMVGGPSSFVQKNGTGTLTLANDNPVFQGGYSIASGTLRVGNGGSTGALGPTAWASVGAAGTLAFDRTGTVTVGGVLSGSGLLRLDGPGEVCLTATNDFTGRVLVNNGRLTLAPSAVLGLSAAVTNLAAIEFETTGSRSQSASTGVIAGSGGIEVTGSGTLSLDRANTYTGTTRVSAGATLRLTRPDQLGSGDVALEGGTLAVIPEVEPGTTELVPALDAADWRLNGAASWTNRNGSDWIQLTPNAGSQAGSAFCNTKTEPGVPWYAAFRYEVGDHPVSAADGMAFVMQNDSRGAAALGGSGGSIGVAGVTPSIGLFFNLYQTPSIGWVVDGDKLDAVSAISGIILTNGVDVALAYDGMKLTLTVTQDAKICTATRTVDLNAKFGGATAYVGFTGGTGGSTAQQFVGQFSLTEAVPVSTDFDNVVAVADGMSGDLSLLLVNAATSLQLDGFDLGAGATLDVSAAAGSKANADYTVAASNVTVAAGTATVGLVANGTGKGILALSKLTVGSGATLVVTGAVSVPGGVLTVVVPTPVPRGITQLADFTGAVWMGGLPTIALADSLGNPIDETIALRNGRLYINTLKGLVIKIR
jgi:autotransporter-associated beta strand protein